MEKYEKKLKKKTKMKNMENRREREKKRGPNGVLPPRDVPKKCFYIMALIGNREAIEAKKKDFEHPRKRRTRRKEKKENK